MRGQSPAVDENRPGRRDERCADSSPAGDERAVSEFAGVAILVAMTVLITASVGMFVLVAEDPSDGPVDANFTFRYGEQASILIVTFDRGDGIDAGNLTVRGEGTEATWSELAGTNESATIAPGSPGSTVQAGRQNTYGSRVRSTEEVRIVYSPPRGNETVLDRWNG